MVSGLIFSILVSCLKGAGVVGLSFNVSTMKDFCQNIFFLAVGYGFSASLLKKAGGGLAVKIAVAACLLITLQDVLGIVLAQVIGLNPCWACSAPPLP